MIIGEIVTCNARVCPDKPGLIDERVVLTWKEVNRRVNQLANALLDLGLKKGDRVVLLSDNCHEFGEFIFGVAKAGLTGVCLNTRLVPSKLKYAVENCQPSLVVVQDRVAPLAREIAPQVSKERTIVFGEGGNYEPLLASHSSKEPQVTVSESDTFLVQYTTGTTGMPKGIELTQRNWMNNCIVRFWLTRLTEDDVYMVTGALYAAGNLGHFLGVCFAAGTAVIPVFSGRSFVEMIEKHRVTFTYLNPTTFRIARDFIEHSDRKYDLSSLRKLAAGGGQPCSGEQLKEMLDYFHIPYTNSSKAYGQAEVCSPATFLLPFEVARGIRPGASEKERKRLESVGKPLGNTLARVVDDNDKDVSPGDTGEILLKGNGVMKGYWKNPEATAKALRGGWYHTSDMGSLDEEGYLYIAGRKDFLIKSGGLFVAPEELENVILKHPAVAEAAVVGLPDEKWGQAVTAVVRLKPGMTASDEDIKEHCRKLVSRYMVPKSVDFVDSIPREAAYGKVNREELMKMYVK